MSRTDRAPEAQKDSASPARPWRGSPREERERASALEHAGRWDEALELQRALFQHALQAGDRGEAVETLYAQARALRGAGRPEEAEELAELCRAVATRLDLVRTAARATNLLAILHFLRGDLDGAEDLYLEALEHARDVGDDSLIGFACQNLGVIANVRGELREARLLYLESVGASVRSGDRSSGTMVYNNLGMICSDLGEYLEAEVYFDRGIEIAERIPDVPMLARLYANRAEPLIRVGDLAGARASLEHAERLGREVQAHSTLATAARYRGIIALETALLDEAEAELGQALAIAREAGLGLAQAEALEEIARLRGLQGRDQEARTSLEAARSAFAEAGAIHDAERLGRRLDEPPRPLPG